MGSEFSAVEVEVKGTMNDTFAEVVQRIEASIAEGNFEETRRLFDSHTLVAWFGFPGARLYEILTTLVQASPGTRDLVYGFRLFLSSTNPNRFIDTTGLKQFGEQGSLGSLMVQAAIMFDLRLQGRPREALEALTRYDQSPAMQPLVDAREGWPLFNAVQQGITAMLAGEFQLALRLFTEAQLRATNPTHRFLTRDAIAKSALIHAAFGDHEEAKSLIERARSISRTSSWAEPGIDTTTTLASLFISEDPKFALQGLNSLDLESVGEMWPFYVYALNNFLVLSGTLTDVEPRISALESVPFPRVDGHGFSGSVFGHARAVQSLRSGNIAAAKKHLKTLDPKLALTPITRGFIELASGNARQALQLALGARESSSGLRHLELLRLVLLTRAYVLLGETEHCLEVIARALQLTHGISHDEAKRFSPAVRFLAEQHFAQWPHVDPEHYGHFDEVPGLDVQLTPRELEVLMLLASNRTRSQIAEELFISLNTLKTQLRSLYRKLDASTKSEAIHKAESRGLL